MFLVNISENIPLGCSNQEISAFLNEWCEVHVHHKSCDSPNKCPVFLLPRLPYDGQTNVKSKKQHSTHARTGYLGMYFLLDTDSYPSVIT